MDLFARRGKASGAAHNMVRCSVQGGQMTMIKHGMRWSCGYESQLNSTSFASSTDDTGMARIDNVVPRDSGSLQCTASAFYSLS